MKPKKTTVSPGTSRRIITSGNPEDYYNIYKGQRGFILGTGPSVAQQDIRWLKNEIVVGVNFAHKMTLPQRWLPTFICTADHLLFHKVMDEYANLETDIVWTDTCAMHNPEYSGTNLANRKGVSIYYTHPFDWNCNTGVRVYQGSSSIGMLAIPWALWLGLNPIYLLGCDCTASGHAYDDKGATSPKAIKLWDRSFRPAMNRIKGILKAEGRQIFNATLGGRLEELERVDFDSLKPQRKVQARTLVKE